MNSPILKQSSDLAAFGFVRYAAIALVSIMLSSAVADARGRETSEINYHPNILGSRLSTELKALAGSDNRAWTLTIADINRIRGIAFPSFEAWLAASPDDPMASSIAEALEMQNQWTGNRIGDGP